MQRFPRALAAAALVLNALLYGVSWWPFRALQELILHGLTCIWGIRLF